jgi:sugar lactone lactonase YvrE
MSRSAVVVSRLLIAGAAWLFLQPGATCAADVPSDGIQSLESEYIVDFWQTEQGLPDNSINAIAQTPDGYLWIATFNGLARFNGGEFVVFDACQYPRAAEQSNH